MWDSAVDEAQMNGERNKRQSFLKMLGEGMTMLHLDARAPGVEVPEQFHNDLHLRLNFSHNFNLRTFVVEDDEVRASLGFGGVEHLCIIPWAAVFGMTSHVTSQFEVWPEDMPRELLDQAQAMAEAAATGETLDADDPDAPAVVGPAVRRHGHLRIIK